MDLFSGDIYWQLAEKYLATTYVLPLRVAFPSLLLLIGLPRRSGLSRLLAHYLFLLGVIASCGVSQFTMLGLHYGLSEFVKGWRKYKSRRAKNDRVPAINSDKLRTVTKSR